MYKWNIITSLALASMLGCPDPKDVDPIADDSIGDEADTGLFDTSTDDTTDTDAGTTTDTSTTDTTTGAVDTTDTSTDDDIGDTGDTGGCGSPFLGQSPTTPAQPLGILSDTTHVLPLGGEFRYIDRGAPFTVLIFAGMGGQWRQAGEYLPTLDAATDYFTRSNVAVAAVVNPYGWAGGHASLDPDLFTPYDVEREPYSTWGWYSWTWNEPPGDLYDPATPGAYPVLIETGDEFENIVGPVDLFVQLGIEAGHRNRKPCAGYYDCNGGTIMSIQGAEGFGLATSLADALEGELDEDWASWDLDHPLGNGFVYDPLDAGIDRWLGTPPHWAWETWGAPGLDIILPTNADVETCYELDVGEPEPAAYGPAPDLYRARTAAEGRGTIAVALRELAQLVE